MNFKPQRILKTFGLLEPGAKVAALAKRLHQFLLVKTVPHSAGSRAVEYLAKTLLMNVAKGDICLGIKATGDDSAIHQDGDMVS